MFPLLQNQQYFAFLYALVALGVFEEIYFNFLLVGHTGFEVDQLFSILTGWFKGIEMRTLEDLVEEIKKAPISPKPSVESLHFTYDWKSHIESLQTAPMENHSFHKSFKFSMEDGTPKFRYKPLPQDVQWLPSPGMKLLKTSARFGPVGAAPFRLETLNLESIEADLTKYFRRLPANERQRCADSWQGLRYRLESIERRKENLPKMKLVNLPKWKAEESEFDFEDVDQEPPRDIMGAETYPEVRGEVKVGEAVAVYSEDVVSRPWVGKIQEVTDENQVKIQWFKKKSKKTKYEGMTNRDGTAYVDVINRNSIMFIGIAATSDERSFTLTPMRYNQIMEEYAKLDN